MTVLMWALTAGSTLGIAFTVCKIIQEERDRREKAAIIKTYYKHYKKNGVCSDCGCLPCNCGS